jgi:hypothetical protein
VSVFSGDADGAGVDDVVGICIPGMCSISVFPGDGEVVGAGDCDGVDMLFIFMPLMSCFFGARRALCFRRTFGLAFDLAFLFDFDFVFGFDIFMPGMSCMLCP